MIIRWTVKFCIKYSYESNVKEVKVKGELPQNL